MIRTALSLMAASLAISGCGGSDANDSEMPSCADVWQVGETLDLDTYEGCLDGDNFIVAITRGCYDRNSQYVGQFATFEDQLWVVQRGTDPSTGDGGTPGKVTDVDPKC